MFPAQDSLKKFLHPRYLLGALLVVGLLFAGFSLLRRPAAEDQDIAAKRPEPVAAVALGTLITTAEIKAVGPIRADNSVTVVALARGTVRSLPGTVGATVAAGTPLAQIADQTVLIGLANARTALSNQQSSLAAAARVADEQVRQAELGVEAAAEGLRAAQIGARAARDTYENTLALRDKSTVDARQNAVIAYQGHLVAVSTALDSADYLLDVEDVAQLPGIEPVLGVKEVGSVGKAELAYLQARDAYRLLATRSVTADNIDSALADESALLGKAVAMTDAVLRALDMTVTSADFPQASLDGQIALMNGHKSALLGARTAADAARQGLTSLPLATDQETSALRSAIEAADSRVLSARTAFDNARTYLETAKRGREQQLQAARSGVDAVRGQLALAADQAADLTVRSPIKGTVTDKLVEIGAEVSIGQPLFKVAQAGLVVVDLDLSPSDAGRLRVGTAAAVRSNGSARATGTVTEIYPAADPATRKVRVEIAVDNAGGEFTPGAFADVTVVSAPSAGGDGYLIPLKSLIITPTERYVFIAVGANAQKVPVETGATEGETIRVQGALTDEDRLIIDGARNLEDGEAIVVSGE